MLMTTIINSDDDEMTILKMMAIIQDLDGDHDLLYEATAFEETDGDGHQS